jgi:hypothetical protein
MQIIAGFSVGERLNPQKFGQQTMPLVRIDLRKGKDAAYRQEIGRVVYEALVSVGVPQNDLFQVIGEHEDREFSL